MNITDVDFDIHKLPWRGSEHTDRGKLGDMLATIFEGQRELMERYHPIEQNNGHWPVLAEEELGQIDLRIVQARFKDLAWRMVEELGEAGNCLKNRPHKTTFQATDVAHFREELADVVHFFVELLITVGIDADTMFELYFRKHSVNEFRQDSNY